MIECNKVLCTKVGMTRMINFDGKVVPGTVLYIKAPQYSKMKRIMIKKPQICSLLKMNLDSLAQKTFNEVITTPHTVKISSRSIGKGFAGVIKRFHFKSGRATHGNSKAHNKLGSTGMTQDPGRVFKGKKMPGHLGNKKKSIRNVKVLYISRSRECVFVYGSIPGSIGCEVTVTKT